MIAITIQTRDEIPGLIRKAKRGQIDSIGRASAYTRTVMKRTLGKRKKPRPEGEPATSRTGRARRSILFAVDAPDQSAIIGPAHRFVGRSMSAHEFGRSHKGDKMPARPFAGPSLEKATPKLAPFWRGAVTK